MYRRLVVLAWIVLLPASYLNAGDDADARRTGLQALNDFIGAWNGSGGPDKPKPDPKDPIWKETFDWSWRFKGDDAWLSLSVRDGKYISGGELRYLPTKKAYSLRLTDAKKQVLEFTGKLEKGYLTLEHTDAATGETQQLVMNAAADGARFVYRYAVRPKGRTLFTKVYQVGASKEGESLGAAAKKNECIVTGGLGTIPVTYMGETYYVCCSGCRDAFNEEPAKFVKAYKEKKSKN
jgi:hypothetical protein